MSTGYLAALRNNRPDSKDAIVGRSMGDEPATTPCAGSAQVQCDSAAVTPCFTPGTMIKTARGETRVEQLRVGDRALTRDNGYQTIRWVGVRTLNCEDLDRHGNLRPIRIRAGALGRGAPERDMMVSPQHRMLMNSAAESLCFGEEEVLVAARDLTWLDGVEQAHVDEVTYLHILFDQHEVVMSDGAWSESFQPGKIALSALDREQRREIISIFPELAGLHGAHEVYPAARATLSTDRVMMLMAS